jgi:exosome complex RNA-binding protein Rrp4
VRVPSQRVVEPTLRARTPPSLSAVSGPKRDWVTGQSVFGELKGGQLLEVSLAHARRLLAPECAVLAAFGAAVPFEVAVGVNGVLWLQAATGEATSCRGLGQVEG